MYIYGLFPLYFKNIIHNPLKGTRLCLCAYVHKGTHAREWSYLWLPQNISPTPKKDSDPREQKESNPHGLYFDKRNFMNIF